MQRSPIATLFALAALAAFALSGGAGCVELTQQVADTSGGADTQAPDAGGGADVAPDDTAAPDGAGDTADDAVAPDAGGPACPDERACNRQGVCAALPDDAEDTAECVDGVWVCDPAAFEVPDYEPVEASCDLLDNDCDGQTDELLPTTDAAIVEDVADCRRGGLCSGAVRAICVDGGWSCVYPDGYESREVSCDGVDNDCDGQTDDDLTRPCSTDCGTGTETCEAGDWGGCDAPAPADEVCDGVDNDCDGATDEELEPPADPGCPAEGVCDGAEPSAVTCEPDGEGGAAWVCAFEDTAGWEADEVSCDELDNDCDGETNEAIDDPASLADICVVEGACASGVTASCAAGGWECDYTGVPGYEADDETLCDGVDNDCDGETDEDLDTAAAPACSEEGVCEGNVLPVCVAGAWDCAVNPTVDTYEPLDEVSCDGLDNDCDGVTDEALTATEGEPIAACLTDGVCGEGVFALCVDATWRCIYPDTREPVEASCDGLDNDCDGETDESLVGTLADCATPPQGVCDDPAAEVSCVDGGWRCNFTSIPTFEQEEALCDGLDNDCDGATDEDAAGDPLADPVAAGCDLEGVCTPQDVVAVCNGAEGYDCDYAAVPNYEAGDETLCDGLDNDCDGDRDEGLDGDPEAAACDLTGVCTVDNVEASCGGATGFSCDYSFIPDWQADDETLCDGLDNDCDGATDEDLTDQTSETDCPTTGVCAAGVPAICESAGWTCLFDQVADYESPEASCDELDNDCDGVTDEDVCTGPGAACVDNTGCDSGACRTDIDGEGQFCAQDATSCVFDSGDGIDQITDGAAFCAGDQANRTCDAGVWGAETACPEETPWCLDIDGACHLCQPGALRCEDATTPGECDATGDAFVPLDACAGDTVCAGDGGCFTTAVGSPPPDDTGAQGEPAVAWQDLGSQQYVVMAWTEAGAEGTDVLVRKLSATTGDPFLVERAAGAGAGDQYGPSMAVNTVGAAVGFLLVAYTDAGGADGDAEGVYVKPFNSFGPASAGPFQVNTTTTGSQQDIRITAFPGADEAIAVWSSNGSGDDGVYYRRYAISTGVPADAAEVAVTTGASLSRPDVAAAADGRFAVVWQAPGGDGSTWDVWLRLFAVGGTPVDVPATLAAGAASFENGPLPRVVAVPDVGWLVVWKELVDGTTGQVVGQVVGADGVPIGAPFAVADDVGFDPGAVAPVSDLATGDVAVLYTSASAPGDAAGTGVAAAAVDAAQSPPVVSPPILVNEATTGDQTTPSATAGPRGAFLSGWETPDTDATGVETRLLLYPALL